MATLSYVKDRRKWRVRYRATNPAGSVFAGSRIFLEKGQAVKFYGEILSQEKMWRSGNISPAESVATAVEAFFSHCKRHTPRTQVHYRMVIERFLKNLPGDYIRLQQIEPSTIQDYLYRLKDSGVLNRTCNAHLTAIKSFCRHFSQRLNIANPAARVNMLEEDPPKARFITPSEFSILLSVADTTAKNRILFLANTGLRASEFASLTPACFTSDSVTVTGKGRKRRTIPLNRTARSVLPALKLGSPNALYLQLSRLALKAGLLPLGPHSLRHYFATQLLLAGVPIIKVSKLLGHRSIRTTEGCYSHILDSDLKGITAVLDDPY